MDFAVRYWDNAENKVSARYFNLKFLRHAAVLDIIHEFNEGIKELNKGQFLQVSRNTKAP